MAKKPKIPVAFCLLVSLNPVDCWIFRVLDSLHVLYLCLGDTYAWTTRDGGHMSGFPRYGNNLHEQAATLQKLGNLSHMWDIIAPGHGHPRIYLGHDGDDGGDRNLVKLNEMSDALEELLR